ncbi:MAG TPA: hypothetical protein VII94_06285 [Candidatus Saccharimonadales bacterium]
MPGTIRPNVKAMEIAYEILKTPKYKRQDYAQKPSPEKVREWFRDSSTAQ